MDATTWITVLAGVGVGGVSTLTALLIGRFARASKGLSDEAEQATYRTLHLMSRAAEHLRGGLHDQGVGRAARPLRLLLGCDVLMVGDVNGTLTVDGPGEPLRDFAAAVASKMTAGDRTRVLRVPDHGQRVEMYAIAAPIVVDGAVVGTLLAFAGGRRTLVIRAMQEVAGWVAAQLRLAELDSSRTALAQAQLRALRAQISPHFIYNALNAIASFINTDPAKARELVLEFADFTRYSFRRQGEFTTLAEELRSIHSYLLLERARFGDRLEVTLQIAPETLSTTIPFLSLQPLVENAVRHGLGVADRGGRIAITAAISGTDVQMIVEDDGAGIDPRHLQQVLDGTDDGDHIGLLNVDTRIRQMYGDAYGLVLETNTGLGTLVRLKVPQSQPGHDEAQLAHGLSGTLEQGSPHS